MISIIKKIISFKYPPLQMSLIGGCPLGNTASHFSFWLNRNENFLKSVSNITWQVKHDYGK